MPATVEGGVSEFLEDVFQIATEALHAEVCHGDDLWKKHGVRLGATNPWDLHEWAAQAVVYAAVRKRYYAQVEAKYFGHTSAHRRVDIGVFSEELGRWAFIEVKPCGPLNGITQVLGDAEKLENEATSHRGDRIRAILAYGFRDEVTTDHFPDKYSDLDSQLRSRRWKRVAEVSRKNFPNGSDYSYLLVGMWGRGYHG